jgi:hypothetical protein
VERDKLKWMRLNIVMRRVNDVLEEPKEPDIEDQDDEEYEDEDW